MLGFLPVVICKRTTCITAAIFGVAATSKPHLSYILRTAAGATLSSSTDRQQQGITPSAFSTRSGADDVKHISSTSPEAVTSKGEDGSQGEAGHPVFTGTADVYTNSADQDSSVATDSNRRWMSADDLGTRVTQATVNTNINQEGQQSEGSSQHTNTAAAAQGGTTAGAGTSSREDAELCHPADPYCQAGEEAPMSDGFHEPESGDDHIPPSSGFPA